MDQQSESVQRRVAELADQVVEAIGRNDFAAVGKLIDAQTDLVRSLQTCPATSSRSSNVSPFDELIRTLESQKRLLQRILSSRKCLQFSRDGAYSAHEDPACPD